MGEYIKHPTTGKEIKIGVCVGHACESFFPREQLLQFKREGYKGFYAGKYDNSIKNMLSNPNTIYPLPIPRKTVFIVKNKLIHDTVVVHLKKARGSVYVWTGLPCEQANNKDLYAVILGERYDAESNSRTIFACDCCDKPFSLNKNEITKLKTKQPQYAAFLKPNLFSG